MKLKDLAAAIGVRLLGDGELSVMRVRCVDDAEPGDLAFASAPLERRAAYKARSTAILVDEEFAADHAHELPCAVLAAPHAGLALSRAIEILHPAPARSHRVHPSAVVDPAADISPDVVVGALAFIDAGVRIGARSVVGPGAVVLAATRIGADVVVGPGVVIGDHGFVFAPDAQQNIPVRSVAGVVIEDDVVIGANVCIDRGVLRDTRVGKGTRIDNLVHVGHDVIVGENVVLVAQVGIAGDARIGDRAVLAGQVGVGPWKVVGPGARVGGQSGVTHDVEENAAVSGTPAIPHLVWLKAMVRLKHLDSLEARVRTLEKIVAER